MRFYSRFHVVFLLIFIIVVGCSSSSTPPEETRPQDSRTFTVNTAALPFAALADSTVETDRWTGVLGNSGYRVEVPKTTWNGMLIMYAHGYAGTGLTLNPYSMPNGLRRYALDHGYAWAAASYSRNYYDVRAGLEDTNDLARNFNNIAAANGRPLAAPTKIYIIGHSLGGHVAAAAVEDENYNNAINKVRYDGALPMCGVVGDTELFDYFAASFLAALKIAGYPASAFPVDNYASVSANVQSALFSTFPSATTPAGDIYKSVMKNLTGGDRPLFDQGFSGLTLTLVWSTFGSDGTIDGILNRQGTDTNAIVYRFVDSGEITPDESQFNESIVRATAALDANRLRRDGLRWIPKVNGEFSVPVVTLHTLGDMYVPFKMEQIYFNRAQTRSGKNWLVQRAIRGVSHCDFTVAEQVQALEDMLKWEQQGIKPAGDDVITAATVGASSYGCQHTINTTGSDDSAGTIAIRPTLPACP